jgi:hypothetical protein
MVGSLEHDICLGFLELDALNHVGFEKGFKACDRVGTYFSYVGSSVPAEHAFLIRNSIILVSKLAIETIPMLTIIGIITNDSFKGGRTSPIRAKYSTISIAIFGRSRLLLVLAYGSKLNHAATYLLIVSMVRKLMHRIVASQRREHLCQSRMSICVAHAPKSGSNLPQGHPLYCRQVFLRGEDQHQK